MRASVIQVTNLGITVKDSPQNTLVFVTRLDTGAPVAGAQGLDRRGSTAASSGPARPAPTASSIAADTPLRDVATTGGSSRSS